MARPLALAGFAYLLGSVAAVYLGSGAALAAGCICLLAAALSMLFSRTGRLGVVPAVLLSTGMAMGCYSGFAAHAEQLTSQFQNRDAAFSGVVCDLPYRQYNRNYCTVQVTSVDGQEQNFQIRLSAQTVMPQEPYSRIEGKLHFFAPEGGEGFDSRSYQASKGILLYAYLYEHEPYRVLPPENPPPYYYALKLRQNLIAAVEELLPKQEASLLNGVMLGDKSGFDQALRRDFQAVGVSHLLSVSGLHMSTMAQLILLLLTGLGVPGRFRTPLACAGILGFMAVTCFVPSVVRSGVMCLLVLAAGLFSRAADPLNSLGFAVLLLCIQNPLAGGDVGLLLSFSATLGLVLTAGPLRRRMERHAPHWKPLRVVYRGVSAALATTLGAVLFTLPIVLLSFRTFSPAAFLANVLMLAPSSLMLQAGALAALLQLLLPQTLLAMSFGAVAGLLADYLRWCASALAKLPGASLPLSQSWVALWIAAVLILLGAVLVMAKPPKLMKPLAVFAAVLFAVGGLSYGLVRSGVTEITVLPTEGGVSVAMFRDGHGALVGCQGFSSSEMERVLAEQGIRRLDYLQLLSGSREECRNAAQILERYPTDLLVMPEPAYLDDFLVASMGNVSEVRTYRGRSDELLWDMKIGAMEGAAFLEAEGCSLLLAGEEARTDALPDNWCSPDFAVLGEPPGKHPRVSAFVGILSLDEESLALVVPKECGFHPVLALDRRISLLCGQDGVINTDPPLV